MQKNRIKIKLASVKMLVCYHKKSLRDMSSNRAMQFCAGPTMGIDQKTATPIKDGKSQFLHEVELNPFIGSPSGSDIQFVQHYQVVGIQKHQTGS